MSRVYPATVGFLNSAQIRNQVEIGYYEGLDGDPWLATDAVLAATPAAGTRWASAKALITHAAGAHVVFDAAGKVFDLHTADPIVLRAVTR